MVENRFQLNETEDVNDLDLAQIDDDLRKEESLFRPMGVSDAPEAIELKDEPDKCPFEIGIAKPRAISLLRLYELTSQPIPTQIKASLGRSQTPILFVHQVTPFSRFGYPPTRVWGLGYQIEDLPAQLMPLDFAPQSEYLEVGQLKEDVRLNFTAEGKFELDPNAKSLLNQIPGLNVQGLSYDASIRNSAMLNFVLKLSMLKIKAGMVDQGVRWDFIEQDERIDRSVTLLQTALIPDSISVVDMSVKAWVRRRRFFGLGAARSWLMPPKHYTVDVER